MSVITETERDVANSSHFTMLLDSKEFIVYTNQSGELFVHIKSVESTLRISNDLILAWTNVLLIPTSLNGISAMKCIPKEQS